ncbi:MAG TPA: 6-carboxytetrahydropterin synthase [Syntrophales bacterium]|nr:6-carboxytetrahydropterin synthase [Syntrophales bacterium]HOL58622.1 6-carboxytetrahydropterin synthase [Syntrophales bacterium]HPO35090.1 6-carboxytetrahydropterin synthase [Syntrophales bacterium]
MFEVSVVEEFSARHALQGEDPHGHNFRVEITVGGSHLRAGHILVDFRDLRARLRAVLRFIDGRNLLELPLWGEGVPSTEAIARYLFRELAGALGAGGIKLLRVTVWEDENARVTYYE